MPLSRISRTRLYTLIFLLGNPVLAPSLLAQGERIEEVLITASRVQRPLGVIPNTVTLIDSAELTQQLSIENDLSVVLGNLIPSFSPGRQKFTSAGETLRGREPLYLIDGVPQSNPLRNGGREGHTIPPCSNAWKCCTAPTQFTVSALPAASST